MKIRRHRLHDDNDKPVPFTESPNTEARKLDPRYLVMHYTAGRSLESSVEWFTNPQAKASAHLVIGRDGSIVQMVPFDRVAWHAGQSRWHGLVGLNHFSVGIELDNAGILTRQGGKWKAWFGGDYPEEELVEAVHQHETIIRGWHAFTSKQLEIATEVAATLVTQYSSATSSATTTLRQAVRSTPARRLPWSRSAAARLAAASATRSRSRP